jgi:hypothetical protein
MGNHINELEAPSDNFCTDCQQKLWKTLKSRIFLSLSCALLALLLLSSCTYLRSAKKESPPSGDDKMISMPKEQVVKVLGEPDMVSKETGGRTMWTYRPRWKIVPNNEGTVYVEFENDSVVKVIRVR